MVSADEHMETPDSELAETCPARRKNESTTKPSGENIPKPDRFRSD